MVESHDQHAILFNSPSMETSFALIGKGFVIIAADTTARSIVKMKNDEVKIMTLSPHALTSYSGGPGSYSFVGFPLIYRFTLR
jgi:20S proteasome alpha/beta subunit